MSASPQTSATANDLDMPTLYGVSTARPVICPALSFS
jgi:hypothetical protein